jgi:hypothetical protein
VKPLQDDPNFVIGGEFSVGCPFDLTDDILGFGLSSAPPIIETEISVFQPFDLSPENGWKCLFIQALHLSHFSLTLNTQVDP